MGHQMFNAHVQCGIWYADDAAHMFLVGVIALVLVAVCSACANWRVVRGGSEQPLAVWADIHICVRAQTVQES